MAIAAECTSNLVERGALLSYKIFDSNGNVCIPAGHFSQSPKLGPFFYLSIRDREDQPVQKTVKSLEVPPGAARIVFSGLAWKPSMKTSVHELHILSVGENGFDDLEDSGIPEWIIELGDPSLKKPWGQRAKNRAKREPGNSEQFRKWSIGKEIVGKPKGLHAIANEYQTAGPKRANKIKVAIICDEFTYNSLSPEFESIILLPETWRDQIEEFQPDLFLCESAWSGVDSKTRPWRGKIYSSVKFAYENRTTLFEILNYTKKHSIPSVFWNKEDPTHFQDRINDFVSTAARFDYVLTTAEEVVPDYRKFLPSDRVGVMQFAAQTRTFNPLGFAERDNGAVFAGAWYKIHRERSQMMHTGFQYVLDGGLDLTIHDRNFGNKSDLQFPEQYSSFIRRPVNHRATAALYRKYSVGLNFNTVSNSKTMFARRIFELAASGTTVVSNYSPGIEKIYGKDMIYFDRDKKLLQDYDPAERSEMAFRALQTTLGAHTYRHRFEEILRFIGMPFTSVREKPTMISRVASHEEAEIALSYFENRTNIYSRLLLVVSSVLPTSQSSAYLTRYMSKFVTVISESLLVQENVPASNFVQTADLIWVDPRQDLSRETVENTLLHGEYTHQPIVLSDRKDIGWSAGTIRSGMRITAPDVVQAILQPNTVRPILEVPR
ncbi:glycosyltransferase [Glutamicibacter arilaitensis]|uniref:CgeB family protein n=1 Tax=Glutamicibacter arilaitensis TaxID=256701 RepID=UPI00385160D0